MSTPAVVQYVANDSVLSGNFNLTLTSATTAGNCLVVVAGYQDQEVIASGGASQTFTLIYDGNAGYGTTIHFRVWVAFNIAAGITSLNFTNGSGAGIESACLEISGVTAQDGANGSLGTGGTGSVTLPSITTAAANDMLVGVFMAYFHGYVWDSTTTTNGFVLASNSNAVALSYSVGPSASSYSTAASIGFSDTVAGFMLALSGSGGGGGSPSVTQRLALLGVGA